MIFRTNHFIKYHNNRRIRETTKYSIGDELFSDLKKSLYIFGRFPPENFLLDLVWLEQSMVGRT